MQEVIQAHNALWKANMPSLYRNFVLYNNHNYSHDFYERTPPTNRINKFGNDYYENYEKETGLVYHKEYNKYHHVIKSDQMSFLDDAPKSNIVHLKSLEPSLADFDSLPDNTLLDKYEDYKCFASVELIDNALYLRVTRDNWVTQTSFNLSSLGSGNSFRSSNHVQLAYFNSDTNEFYIQSYNHYGTNATGGSPIKHVRSLQILNIYCKYDNTTNTITHKIYNSTIIIYPYNYSGINSNVLYSKHKTILLYNIKFLSDEVYQLYTIRMNKSNDFKIVLHKTNFVTNTIIQEYDFTYNVGANTTPIDHNPEYDYNVSTYYEKINNNTLKMYMFFPMNTSAGARLNCKIFTLELNNIDPSIATPPSFNIISEETYKSNITYNASSIFHEVLNIYNKNNVFYIEVVNSPTLWGNDNTIKLLKVKFEHGVKELDVEIIQPSTLNLRQIFKNNIYIKGLTTQTGVFQNMQMYLYNPKDESFTLMKQYNAVADIPESIKITDAGQLLIMNTASGGNSRLDKFYLYENPKLKIQYTENMIDFDPNDIIPSDPYSGTVNIIKFTHDTMLPTDKKSTFLIDITGSNNYIIHNGQITQQTSVQLSGQESIDIPIVLRSGNTFDIFTEIYKDVSLLPTYSYLSTTVNTGRLLYPKVVGLRYCVIKAPGSVTYQYNVTIPPYNTYTASIPKYPNAIIIPPSGDINDVSIDTRIVATLPIRKIHTSASPIEFPVEVKYGGDTLKTTVYLHDSTFTIPADPKLSHTIEFIDFENPLPGLPNIIDWNYESTGYTFDKTLNNTIQGHFENNTIFNGEYAVPTFNDALFKITTNKKVNAYVNIEVLIGTGEISDSLYLLTEIGKRVILYDEKGNHYINDTTYEGNGLFKVKIQLTEKVYYLQVPHYHLGYEIDIIYDDANIRYNRPIKAGIPEAIYVDASTLPANINIIIDRPVGSLFNNANVVYIFDEHQTGSADSSYYDEATLKVEAKHLQGTTTPQLINHVTNLVTGTVITRSESLSTYTMIDDNGNDIQTVMHPNFFSNYKFTNANSEFTFHQKGRYICFFIAKVVIMIPVSRLYYFKELLSTHNDNIVEFIQLMRLLYSYAEEVLEDGTIILRSKFSEYNPVHHIIYDPTWLDVTYGQYLELTKVPVSSLRVDKNLVLENQRMNVELNETTTLILAEEAFDKYQLSYDMNKHERDTKLVFSVALDKLRINEGDSFVITVKANLPMLEPVVIYPYVKVYNRGFYDKLHPTGTVEPYSTAISHPLSVVMPTGSQIVNITVNTLDDYDASAYLRYLLVGIGIQNQGTNNTLAGIGGYYDVSIKVYNYTNFDFRRYDDVFTHTYFNSIDLNYNKDIYNSPLLHSKIDTMNDLILLPVYDDDFTEAWITTSNIAPVKEGYSFPFSIMINRPVSTDLYVYIRYNGAQIGTNVFAKETIIIPAGQTSINVITDTIRNLAEEDYNIRVELIKMTQGMGGNADLRIDPLRNHVSFTLEHLKAYQLVPHPVIPFPPGIGPTITGTESRYGIRQAYFFATKPVSGMRYVTETMEGYGLMIPQYITAGQPYVYTETSAAGNGGNLYLSRPEYIRFFIGNMQIGEAFKPSPLISPIDLFPYSTVNSIEVINVCRILEALSDVPFNTSLTNIQLDISTLKDFSYSQIDWASEEAVQTLASALNITTLPQIEQVYFRYRDLLIRYYGPESEKVSPIPKLEMKVFKILEDNSHLYMDKINARDIVYCRIESTVPIRGEIEVEVEMYSDTLVRNEDYTLIQIDNEGNETESFPYFVVNQNSTYSNMFKLKFENVININSTHAINFRVSEFTNTFDNLLLGGMPYMETTVQNYSQLLITFS